eukprot:1026421-Rhodomonas_salina.2
MQCSKPQFKYNLYQECGFLYLILQWIAEAGLRVPYPYRRAASHVAAPAPPIPRHQFSHRQRHNAVRELA